MKKALPIIRWIVGLLFIFSGLIKANDPLGLSYKMQEFFNAWGISSVNFLALGLSIFMNTLEIVLGVAMIVGIRMKFFTRIIFLLTLFFAFLTGYAWLSGKFRTCGCFGDCLPLSPFDSFLKDLVLLVLISIILKNHKKVIPHFKQSALSLVVLLLSIFVAVGLQAYTLEHLPVLDCLAYKQGNHLLEEMKIPKGAISDSFAITFKYEKAGKTVEFDANHFPADFDSSYTYVDRYEKLVRKGNATPAITDFSLQTLSGNDSTQAILQQPNMYILVLVQSFEKWRVQKEDFYKMLGYATAKGLKVFVASPQIGDAVKLFPQNITLLRLDAVVEKTAARANPTYFLMKGDQILEKKSYADIQSFMSEIQ
ncbi:MAG TPA: BT_3928 family protein [Arachidicoccus soli]|nr:BT_3928 family protein [Arachidicoccus soli]